MSTWEGKKTLSLIITDLDTAIPPSNHFFPIFLPESTVIFFYVTLIYKQKNFCNLNTIVVKYLHNTHCTVQFIWNSKKGKSNLTERFMVGGSDSNISVF